MAKQKGIFKVEGTLGDVTFYKTADGYIAKEVTSISGKRIASDPSFQRTRENMAEFGRAGKAGKVMRNAIRILLQQAKGTRVSARLTAVMMKVIKADTTSSRGKRNVLDGELELLKGFEFNNNAILGTTMSAPYTTEIDRATGKLTVEIASFVPTVRIVAPAGSTHFNIVSMGTEIDFGNESFVSDIKETGPLSLEGPATDDISLVNTVTPQSTKPLFLLLGIQFTQFVNGTYYPLKDGSFNALTLVQVSGEE